MNEPTARKILEGSIQPDGGLYSLGWYLGWKRGDGHATLDGQFTPDDLEAIAWWMRHSAPPLAKEQSKIINL